MYVEHFEIVVRTYWAVCFRCLVFLNLLSMRLYRFSSKRNSSPRLGMSALIVIHNFIKEHHLNTWLTYLCSPLHINLKMCRRYQPPTHYRLRLVHYPITTPIRRRAARLWQQMAKAAAAALHFLMFRDGSSWLWQSHFSLLATTNYCGTFVCTWNATPTPKQKWENTPPTASERWRELFKWARGNPNLRGWKSFQYYSKIRIITHCRTPYRSTF